jgi:hypothetical protein
MRSFAPVVAFHLPIISEMVFKGALAGFCSTINPLEALNYEIMTPVLTTDIDA